MYKYFITLILTLLLVLSCSNKSSNPVNHSLIEKLEAIPGITVTAEPTTPDGYQSAYKIDLIQPVDHNNPEGATFVQTFYLSHKHESAPMVLATTGYRILSNAIREETGILGANQIRVGHRYMQGAEISPVNWQYLTMAQASADYHRIVEFLKPIYTGKWISRGASKGGMTALFHKRFYPDDIDVVITKVAPLPLGPDDQRFTTFFNEIGDQACRDRMRQFQIEALQHKNELIPMINDYVQNSSDTWSYDAELMLEYAVLEYPFAFWQYGAGNCNQVPGSGSSVAQIYQALSQVVEWSYYSDRIFDIYEPAYYHVLTELGYYGFITDHLDSLLVTDNHYSNDIFAPQDVDLVFDYTSMPDVINWLQTEGDQIIYIYGENDPWSAAALEHIGTSHALLIMQSGGNHNLRLSDIDQYDEVIDSLESWLDMNLSYSAAFAKQAIDFESEEQRHRPY